MGYKGGDNFITSPKGELFKYEWKDHRWSWRSIDSKKKQTETRLFGMRPDKNLSYLSFNIIIKTYQEVGK